MIPTPPTLAGLFFCLTSAEGARLLFCPAIIQPHTSVYKGLYSVYATIPPTPQNSAQGFTSAFPAVCTILQPQIADHASPAASRYSPRTAPQHLQRIPDTRRNAGRCTGQHSHHIIIRYIKRAAVRPLLWIHVRQCSRSQTMPARRRLDTPHAQRLEI